MQAPAVAASRAEWCVAIAISAWVLVLQFLYASHAGPLWRDEASSVNFSLVPTVSQMWDNFRFDNFPPLFAFVLRWFGAAGFSNDLSYRILGLVISISVLAAIWIGSWMVAKRPPLIGLALFAINPLAIKTDGAIRPYGLGYAFLIVTIALIYAYARQPRRLWFVLACIAGVLSVQTLYQAAFFIAAAIFGVLIDALAQKQRRVAGMVILIGCIGACSLAINLPHLLHDWGKAKWVGQSSFEISKTAVTWDMLANAFWRAVSTEGAAGGWLSCLIAIAIVALGFRNRRARPFVLSLLCGTIIYLCFLRFSGLHSQSWYFLIVLAVAALWLEGIAASFVQKTIRQGVLVAAVLITVVSVPAALDVVRTRATSLDLVGQVLQQRATPKDVVLTMPWYYGVTLGRYYKQKFTTVPPLSDVSIHRYDLVQKAMETPEPIVGLMHDIEQSLRNGGTVWTIGEIILPKDGEQVPFLPPYTTGNGYSDSDYLTSWSMQIADFLGRHAQGADVVKLPDVGAVSPLENPKVVALRGWRD
ncbi:MAG: hypothetical protein ACXWDN_18370 [Limisphaerales bacterium]